MTIEQNGVTFYTPAEAAEFVGTSVSTLAYYRRTGRIEGLGTGNNTLYTEKALKDFKRKLETGESRSKRGPKSKKIDEASDEGGAIPPSVIRKEISRRAVALLAAS